MQPRNLAARAGRWSATHRKTAIIGWIAFVVLATLIGGKVGQQNLEPSASGNGESKRGAMIVDEAALYLGVALPHDRRCIRRTIRN